MNPYIHVHEDSVEIIGDAEGLEALGSMLILKAKLGKNFSATLQDGTNIPIKIISNDEFILEDES